MDKIHPPVVYSDELIRAIGEAGRIVPLVVYNSEGVREVIGEAKVYDDGSVSGAVYDSKLAEKLHGGLGQFSINVHDFEH